MRLASPRWLIGAALVLSLAAPARADAPAPEATEASETSETSEASEVEEAPVAHPIPRREVPDYDGRDDPPRSAADVLLDVPRLLLAPLYFVLEYLVRQPLGWLFTTAEREQWDLFRYLPFADDPLPWGLVPTTFIDFGFLPSVGLYLWIDHALARDNHFSAQIGFGGIDWLRGTIVDRFPIGPGAVVELSVDAWQRPDYLFLGLGSGARPDRVARYGRRNLDASAEVRIRPYRSSQLRVIAGVSANELYDTREFEDGELNIVRAVEVGWFGELPPGFTDGYFAYSQRLDLAFDSRENPPGDAGGVRVEGHAELGFDLNRPLDRRWLLWGGAAGGYWDIDQGRVLGAWGSIELASRLGPEPVPFTELPDLAVLGRMPGFRNGWITGAAAVAFGIDYAFPIAPWLDGFVAAAAGGAFAEHFANFSGGLLRMSYALGVRAGSPDQPFVLQAGFGTAPFDEGGGPQVFRLTFGSQPGGL